jgi:uncharacterized membrane protein
MGKFAIRIVTGIIIGVGISVVMHEYRKARRG